MFRSVELTLVDLSLEVEEDSKNHGGRIKKLVLGGLHGFPSSHSHQISKTISNRQSITTQYNKNNNNNNYSNINNNKWLQDAVLRFLKLSDQYLALTSVLLKSKAFYVSLVPSLVHDKKIMANHSANQPPVIELPRTEYGKPYIPPPCTYSEADVHAYFPLSISHQFPFAGTARLKVLDNDEVRSYHPPCVSSFLVGLDIVVFEDFNPRLYQSALEFVSVFQDSFTEWEWEHCILKFAVRGSDRLLKEFYLRWSIKEAYTKAMGLGMAIEFSSFETCIGDLDCTNQGLWEGLAGNDKSFRCRGTITIKKSQGKSQEDWEFYFKPLYIGGQEGAEHRNEPDACASICVGPYVCNPRRAGQTDPTSIKTSTTSLEDLLRWHGLTRIAE